MVSLITTTCFFFLWQTQSTLLGTSSDANADVSLAPHTASSTNTISVLDSDPVVQATQAAKEAAQSSQKADDLLLKIAEQYALTNDLNSNDPNAKSQTSNNTLTLRLNLTGLGNYGNASALNSKISFVLKWLRMPWQLTADGLFAYGTSKSIQLAANAQPLVTANNQAFNLRTDFFLSQIFSSYFTLGAYADRVSSVAYGVFGELGLSMIWWKTNHSNGTKSSLSTDLGFKVLRELWANFYPNYSPIDNPASVKPGPNLTLNFNYSINQYLSFDEKMVSFLDVVLNDDYRFESASILTAQITKSLTVNIGFSVRYYGYPAPHKSPSATELSTGISWLYDS